MALLEEPIKGTPLVNFSEYLTSGVDIALFPTGIGILESFNLPWMMPLWYRVEPAKRKSGSKQDRHVPKG